MSPKRWRRYADAQKANSPIQFVVMTGDNFYERGVRKRRRSAMARAFRAGLRQSALADAVHCRAGQSRLGFKSRRANRLCGRASRHALADGRFLVQAHLLPAQRRQTASRATGRFLFRRYRFMGQRCGAYERQSNELAARWLEKFARALANRGRRIIRCIPMASTATTAMC